MASVAIGLTLAVHGGVHAYHQHVENQRVAEAVKEEQAANQRRQKFLDQIPKYDELWRDEYIYNEADYVLGGWRYDDIADSYEANASNRARLNSPKEFEECFHITPEDYQKQCLEKYGINADDFADDTGAEALQRYNEVKQDVEECAAKWGYGELRAIFDSRELRALLDGDFSYFKKSKESKVKQALNAKISELRWARDEAIRQQLDQADTNQRDNGELPNDVKGEDTGYHPSDSGGEQDFISMDEDNYTGTRPHGNEADKPDRSSWNDDNEMSRHDHAYHKRGPEQRDGGREEISDTIDLW